MCKIFILDGASFKKREKLTCLYSSRVMVPSLSVSCMLNKTAERTKNIVNQASAQQEASGHVFSRRRTSQLLPPDVLSLLLGHVQRRRPEMGHDHQELTEADLVHRAHAVLAEVPGNKAKTKRCSDISSHRSLFTRIPWERKVQATVPPVKEGLDDLRADGIARQILDSIEVISPESTKQEGFVLFCFFKKEWRMFLQDTLNNKLRSVCTDKSLSSRFEKEATLLRKSN